MSDVVGAWLEARGSCDLDALCGLTAADARWVSPVVGEVRGRNAVIAQIEAGVSEADRFATEVISVEERGERAVAVVRNTGTRNGETLDSLQTLFTTVRRGLVAAVRVAVDDPEAIEAFWSE